MQAHGFRFCFTPLSAVLFTFPSRYSSTIGLPGVLSLGGWCRQIRTGFLRPRPTQVPARVRAHSGYGAVTRCGPPFQARSPMCSSSSCRRPYNPARASTPAVWALPLSLAATRGVTVVFLSSDYLDVSVRRVGLPHGGMARLQRAGLPHSDTRGSRAARASPRIFAACRVLHRLREPRHPPCALVTLARLRARPPPPGDRTCPVLVSRISLVSNFGLLSFHPVNEPPAEKAGCSGE